MLLRSRTWLSLGVVLVVLGLSVGVASAQAKNPCNPCGPKNPCNPCGGKVGAIPVNPCHAKAGTVFYIDDPKGRNSATFTSEAPLEDIVGTTRKISGYIVFDPADPKKGGVGVISVSVASLDTGIPLRDEHLRSPGWLDAARYPLMTYHINGTRDVKEVSRTDDHQTYNVTLVGKFDFHGQSKDLEVPARITYMRESEMTRQKAPGDLLAGRASFEIQLSEFGVTGPKGMEIIGAKVSNSPKVSVTFVASSKKPGGGNPCNPCGGKAKNPCNPCGGKRLK